MASGTENQSVSQKSGASTTAKGSARKPSGGTENQSPVGSAPTMGRRPSVSQPIAGTANVSVSQHSGASTTNATPSVPPVHGLIQSKLPKSLPQGEPQKQLNVDGALSIVKGGGGSA